MKFNFQYVKQHPVMFGVIFLVFGLFLWLLLSRGTGGSSGGLTVQNVGKDPATLAAETALAQTQLQAQAAAQAGQLQLAAIAQQGQNDLALQTVNANVALAQLASEERLGEQSLTLSLRALESQLMTDIALTQSNNQFQIDYAKVSADSAVEALKVGADLQKTLAGQQLEAFKFGSFVATIPSLKKKNRDNLLRTIVPQVNGYTGAGVVNTAPAGVN